MLVNGTTKQTAPTQQVATELGLSGLRFSGGYVQEEFLSDLNSWQKRYKTYNEMRQNDPVIAATLTAFELAIRRVDWRIEGEEGDPRVAFIEQQWKAADQNWANHLAEVATMIAFGFSLFEIVYRQNPNGSIGWERFAFRSQDSIESWVFNDKGIAQAAIQRTYPKFETVTLPLGKCIHYVTSSEKRNPEGKSFLRSAYVPYYYAKNLRAVEAIAAERDLAGLPVVYMPKNPQEGDSESAQKIVRRARNDEESGIVVPNPKGDPAGWHFELLSSPGSKQMDIAAMISRYEKRMASVLLAQFIMLGMDGVGSYSLSKDQSDLFTMAVGTIVNLIGDTFTRQAIVPLLKLNGMDSQNPPQLAHGVVGDTDRSMFAQALAQLTGAGLVTPSPETEIAIREMMDLPPLEIEDSPEIEIAPSSPQIELMEAQPKWRRGARTYLGGDRIIITDRDIEQAIKELPIPPPLSDEDWKRLVPEVRRVQPR